MRAHDARVVWAVALLLLALVVAAFVIVWVGEREDRGASRALRLADGTQEARVVVERGYRPSRIDLELGVPATLRFDRREDDSCSELLVSELWPSAHRLAPNAETEIRFTPERLGRFTFTCGMGMYSGELRVHGPRAFAEAG